MTRSDNPRPSAHGTTSGESGQSVSGSGVGSPTSGSTAAASPPSESPTPRRITGVVNPVSGKRDAAQRWDQVQRRLAPKGHDVSTVFTESGAHAIATARELAADGSIVVAVGGDGLVRDVAAGVVKGGGTMAIVPAGRGNDLAGVLGIPVDLNAAAAMLDHGEIRHIDVLDVNNHLVPGNVYVGVDSLAARYINNNRRLPALALYRGAGLAAAARWKRTEFTLTFTPANDAEETMVPEETIVIAAHDIVISNSGRYGNGLQIVPSAAIDDGLIDILVVRHGSPMRIVTMMLAAQKGTHVHRADVEVLRARSIRIEADRHVPFGADGDEVTTLPATVTVRHRALAMLVP